MPSLQSVSIILLMSIHPFFSLCLAQVQQTSASCPSAHRAWERRARATAPASQMLLDPTTAFVHMDSR